MIDPIRTRAATAPEQPRADASVSHVLSELAALERMCQIELRAILDAPVAQAERVHRVRQIEEQYRSCRSPLARRLGAIHQAGINEALFGGPVTLGSLGPSSR